MRRNPGGINSKFYLENETFSPIICRIKCIPIILKIAGIFIGIMNFIFWQMTMLLCFALIIIMGIVEIFNLSSLITEKIEQKQQEYLNVKKSAEKVVSTTVINFIYISCAAVSILLSIISYKLVIGVEKVKTK